MEQFYSTHRAAEMAGLHRNRVISAVQDGLVVPTLVVDDGRQYIWNKSAIEQLKVVFAMKPKARWRFKWDVNYKGDS